MIEGESTSRSRKNVAVPVEVDVLARAESAAILQSRVSGLGASAADRLAAELGVRLARQSLARVDQRGLVMHRLTQAILRDRLTSQQAAAARGPA